MAVSFPLVTRFCWNHKLSPCYCCSVLISFIQDLLNENQSLNEPAPGVASDKPEHAEEQVTLGLAVQRCGS